MTIIYTADGKVDRSPVKVYDEFGESTLHWANDISENELADALDRANAKLIALRAEIAALKHGGIGRIAAEQRRQRDIEHWTEQHDDEHDSGQLARAGACYALSAASRVTNLEWRKGQAAMARNLWPWDEEWYKPKDQLRDLERAGALIASEIDRILRRAALEQTR